MKTDSLRELQRAFQARLLGSDRQIDEQVVGSENASAETRLAIYADAYRLRLLEALREDFPVLRAFVGNEQFDKLGYAYIDVHPAEHFSIRYFGEHLSQFLAQAKPYVNVPVLSEMASFEWALRNAFDAADSNVVSVDNVAALTPTAWSDMRLRFQASLARLDLIWNVPAIWNAVQEDREPESPTAAEYPVPWLIWRRNLKTYFRSLSVDESWAIDAASNDACFARICEGLCEWIDAENVAQHAAGLLKRWVMDELIAKIEIG